MFVWIFISVFLLRVFRIEAGTFEIDYANNVFLKDGKTFQYISGEVLYSRIHPDLWNDRLMRIRALGFNAVQTYVPWNLHEPLPGSFDFTGRLNLTQFVLTAQQNDLNVLLRPGPYICAEWENADSAVNDYVLGCGSVDGVFPTIDVGMNHLKQTPAEIDSYFQLQRNFSKGGPKVCSEFYPGWITYWDVSTPSFPTTDDFMASFEYMYTINASFSVYMVHGGTNFGFQNGASYPVHPVLTSYDYNAPISENGATTILYQRIHSFLQNQSNWVNPPQPIPQNPPATAYGQVALQRVGTNLISALTQIQEPCQNATQPLVFEDLNHGYGFVLYTNILANSGVNLKAPSIRDYGYVFVNNVYQGMLSREQNSTLNISIQANAGDVLRVLVENRGRTNVGGKSYEYGEMAKGLHWNVTLDGNILSNWFACGINLTKASVDTLTSSFFDNNESIELSSSGKAAATSQPGVYIGKFTGVFQNSSNPTDTFFNSTGWGKGQLFINGYNLGRYWSVGPQVTLYVPSPVIQQSNTVLLVELIGSQTNTANFIDHAIFNFH